MPLPFEGVREQLLRAGIAPRHVRRYIVELREHLDDLTARERDTGLESKEACERARALLGTDAQLAQAMIDKTPRSLAARAPWAMFAILPVLALVVTVLAIVTAMMHLLWPVHAAWHSGVPNTYTGLIAAASFIASCVLGPAVMAGCMVLALRQRLVSPWVWIGIALIAFFGGLLGFHMNVLPAHDRHPGGAVFSILPTVIVNGRVNVTATFSMVALRAAVLFAIAAVVYRALRRRLVTAQA